jgi:hypothetical protein
LSKDAARIADEMIEEHSKVSDIITLLSRDGEKDTTIFCKGDYQFHLTNVTIKSGSVTAKITLMDINGELLYRDNINMSKSVQRKRFKIKDYEYDIDQDLMSIEDMMIDLINEEVTASLNKTKQGYVMTDKEKKAALSYLKKQPHILKDIMTATDKIGIVGEKTNRLMVYLVFTSRIMQNPLSLTIKGESSSGKSYVAMKVMKLIPEEGVRFMTRATAQALFHLPEDGMRHKIIFINELPGSETADYAIRSAQSEGDLILMMPVKDPVTGDMSTTEKIVRGPAGFLSTTTKMDIFHENETRNFSIFSDDSPKQTRDTGEITIQSAMGDVFELENGQLELFQNIQRLLSDDLKVIIPFAREIFEAFPDKPVRIRRDREKFKTLIEVITVLHQHHRKIEDVDGDKVIYATVGDYFLAKIVAEDVLFASIYQMPPQAETLLNTLRDKIPEGEFTYKDIQGWMGDWTYDKCRKLIRSLINNNFVKYAKVYGKDSKEQRQFKLADGEEHTKFLIDPTDLMKAYPCDVKLLYNPYN